MDKDEFFVEDALQSVATARIDTRKRRRWFFKQTDETPAEVAASIGMPDVPAFEGLDSTGKRLVAVWVAKGPPQGDPPFITPGPYEGVHPAMMPDPESLLPDES